MLEQELRFKITPEQAKNILFDYYYYKEIKQEDFYYKGKFKGIIRIRKYNEKYEICHKYFVKDSWEEWESEITEEASKAFKEALKDSHYMIIEKNRKTFKYKNAEINIDDIKDLGLFCEIEMMGGNKKDLRKIAQELKLEDEIKVGYVQLYEQRFSKTTK